LRLVFGAAPAATGDAMPALFAIRRVRDDRPWQRRRSRPGPLLLRL